MSDAVVPDELLDRIRRFHDHTFPGVQAHFQTLVSEGQHPSILFIGLTIASLVLGVLGKARLKAPRHSTMDCAAPALVTCSVEV